MRIRSGLALAAVAASLTMALAGCGQLEPVGAPVPTAVPTTAPEPSTDPAAAWLDGGRGIGLVTYGSSSLACTPAVQDVTADGQTVVVTLADPDPKAACTADFVPRATFIDVPASIDPAADVTVSFDGAGFAGRVPLSGSSALGSVAQGTPSAGWFAPDGIVLLTWGSSTCRPVVSGLAEEASGATVTFATDATKACTMDFVPRVTVLGVTAPADPSGYTLTLKGGGLDGEVTVVG
ncbi:MAG: hypothetical protein JST25_03530 [Actinobacteria bacterium]|nr:hypothetical protein [Actinomycetota bacterium]